MKVRALYLLVFQTGPVATHPENCACLPVFSLVVKLTWGKSVKVRLVQGERLTKTPEKCCQQHKT